MSDLGRLYLHAFSALTASGLVRTSNVTQASQLRLQSLADNGPLYLFLYRTDVSFENLLLSLVGVKGKRLYNTIHYDLSPNQVNAYRFQIVFTH